MSFALSWTKLRYLSVVESLLCPSIFESRTIETPCLRWWATKVWRRSFTLALSIPAMRKYLSMAVRILRTKNGLPDLVTKMCVS